MIDTTYKNVQVKIGPDGNVIWINTEKGCVFRAQNVEKVQIVDERERTMNRNQKDDDITVLLGFLDANRWVNAIKEHGVDKEHAFDLIRDQEQAYGGELLKEVKELLTE
jgi:hypothetical protein